MAIMRKVNRPPIIDFVAVFVMETLHVSGLAILFFGTLPYMDSLRGMMLTSGVSLVPGILKMLKDFGRTGKYMVIIYTF